MRPLLSALHPPTDASYRGTLGLLRPLELHQVEVEVDDDGLSSKRLASVLENWHSDPSTKDSPFPKVLYTMSASSPLFFASFH